MNKIEIDCPGCGAKLPVTVADGHRSIAKCDCGAITYVQSASQAPDIKLEYLKELNKLIDKVPKLFESFSDSKRKSLDTGIDQALHDAAERSAHSLLKGSAVLQEGLDELVRASLEAAILPDAFEHGEGGHQCPDCEGHEGDTGEPGEESTP